MHTSSSPGMLVTVAKIRKPFKWRTLLIQLIRSGAYWGNWQIIPSLCQGVCVCGCVMETSGSEERTSERIGRTKQSKREEDW